MELLKTIATVCGTVTAIAAVATLLWKLFGWVNHQKEQDRAIEKLRGSTDAQQRACAKEQTLIVRGLLACLKGLREQGCNGPVTDMIGEIENYINQRAHE